MSKRQFEANLMIATCLFSSVLPVVNAVASKTNISSEITAGVSSGSQSKTSVETSADKIQTLISQTMILNKIIAKQGSVVGTTGTDDAEKLEYKGVNKSTFKVFDVTDLMNTILKEQLKTDKTVKASDITIDKTVDQTTSNTDQTGDDENEQTSSTTQTSVAGESSSIEVSNSQSKDESTKKASDSGSATTSSAISKTSKSVGSGKNEGVVDESLMTKIKDLQKGDKLRELVANRAYKLSSSQLKTITTVKTEYDSKLKRDGIARVKLPIDGKFHAYYVVNTDTPKEAYATNADPIVIFTPVTNENGMYSDEFMIYPKSDSISKPTPKTPAKVTSVPMYQTGTKHQSWFRSLLDTIWNWF